MVRTCFVIMAIGNQHVGDKVVASESELRSVYEDVIKPALLHADPELEVARADETNDQGTITTDILTKLMHSDFVVADITHPNPNVYYELGVRHACRPGTIIIRHEDAQSYTPFDLAHQRYISYDSSAKGMRSLGDQLKARFDSFADNPKRPDNHLLEHAKSSKFNFPQYGEELALQRQEGLSEIVRAVVSADGAVDALLHGMMQQTDIPPFMLDMIKSVANNEQALMKLMSGLMKMGVLNKMLEG